MSSKKALFTSNYLASHPQTRARVKNNSNNIGFDIGINKNITEIKIKILMIVFGNQTRFVLSY